MQRLVCVLVTGLLGVVLPGVGVPRQAYGQTEIPTVKLVSAMRLLNTQEYSYRRENGRFADKGELLDFLQKNGQLSCAAIDLENPEPYDLAITTSKDGMHYQIRLARPSKMNDKSTWCKTAAFSDDSGLIFLGSVIGCEDAPK